MTKARTPQLHVTTNTADWIHLVYREARRIAGTLCHEDDLADDLTHNLMIEVLNAKDRLPFVTTWWLIARLRARLVNHQRWQRRSMQRFAPLPEYDADLGEPAEFANDEAESAEHQIWLRQLEKRLRQAIAALPTDEMRKIIWLKAEGVNDNDIAKIIKKSPNVAMTRRLEAQVILQIHLCNFSDARPPMPKSLRRMGREFKEGLEKARAMAAE